MFGVKIILTTGVGDPVRYCYEELILRVKADSYDEAYEKAEAHARLYADEYQNPFGETVRTLNIEAVDCFLAFEPEGDVEEVYSSISTNHAGISEEAYRQALTSFCDEEELRALQNAGWPD